MFNICATGTLRVVWLLLLVCAAGGMDEKEKKKKRVLGCDIRLLATCLTVTMMIKILEPLKVEVCARCAAAA